MGTSCCHPPPAQAHLAKFTGAETSLSLMDWCSCFSRCPELLGESPAVLSDRLTKLKGLMAVDDEELVGSVTKAPSLLQHAPADIAEKVCSGHVCWALAGTKG